MTSSVSEFLSSGCGRCKWFATPHCNVIIKRDVIMRIRALLLEFPFQESIKWGQLCYSVHGRNSVLISAVKGAATISFFRGFELADPHGVLELPGEESRTIRWIKLTDLREFEIKSEQIKSFLLAAYQLEFSQDRANPPAPNMTFPELLVEVFSKDEQYAEAFGRLTKGRQRGYLIFFRQAKQKDTCLRRIHSCREKVMKGEGR